MIHPHTAHQWINAAMGHGVFATRFIPRGTIMWSRCPWDQKFSAEEVLEKKPEFYAFLLNNSSIDHNGNLSLFCDDEKYMNHSCDPNVLYIDADTSLAVRDIQQGEQITCDYGILNIIENLHCLCKAHNCRQVIGPDDAKKYGKIWRQKVQENLHYIPQVPQPLFPFLNEPARINALIANKISLPDHAEFYCPPHLKKKLKKIFL